MSLVPCTKEANFNHSTQMFLFAGVFFAFAVKTPTIFL
jgi:NADH:ubiquinone oxidoreductase subunit 4 (subunit M)